jgi:ABC-type amino acid transport substrate-binding protein
VQVDAIDFDVRDALTMFEAIAGRAAPARLDAVVERVGADASGRITGVPVGETGALSRGFTIRRRGDVVEIVNTVPYARFVFGGTRFMDAQPPNVPAAQIARDLANAVAREVFG